MDEVFDPMCDPDNPRNVTADRIKEVREMIKSGVVPTPCIKCHVSDQTGMELYAKTEFCQYTGSFKDRGARASMMMLGDDQKMKGVVGASAGNHAQGLSYQGLLLGIPVTVVMPVTAPIMKVQKCKRYKANVILEGKDMQEAKIAALKYAKSKGCTYINGYDHPDVLAGAGSIGLEIVEEVSDIDAVIIPVGGGGLIAGISAAVKAMSPKTLIIGAESEKCCAFAKALEAGKPIISTCDQSLADGLAVPMVGVNAFETASHHLDRMVVVKEEMIAMAILALVELEKWVVEGAGATALGAILSGVLPELRGKKVVMIVSGGNIDTTVLGRVLDRGLAVLGRLIKFHVTIRDRPGGISELMQKLTDLGVSVKEVIHERPWVLDDIFSVRVTVICETRNIDDALLLKKSLEAAYAKVDFRYFPNVCTARTLGF